jgi:hypothetical protein
MKLSVAMITYNHERFVGQAISGARCSAAVIGGTDVQDLHGN